MSTWIACFVTCQDDRNQLCQCFGFFVFVLHRLVCVLSYESLKRCLPYIIPTLTSRLAVQEVVESSEELRLSLVELVSELIKTVDDGCRAARADDVGELLACCDFRC